MKCYPSDVSDSQWQVIKGFLNSDRKRRHDLRNIVNGVLYLVKTGTLWRYLPGEFGPWQTVHYYFNVWKHSGVYGLLLQEMVKKKRVLAGRDEQPTVGIMDSQSVKATLTSTGGNTGFDAGRRTKGIKRHIVADSLGLMLCVVVHSAGVQDRHGALLVLEKLKKCWAGIGTVFADGGYSGKLIGHVKNAFGYLLAIVKKNELRSFKVLPKRWLVERAFAWIDTNRRAAKSYERRTDTLEAITQIATLRILLKRS